MTPEEAVLQQAQQDGVQLVRLLYCGNDGTIRAKATHAGSLAARLRGGIGLTPAMQVMNMLDRLSPLPELGFSPVGEVRMFPDPATYRRLPWDSRSAMLLADLLTLEMQPWEACPRSFLKRMAARAAAQGLVVRATFEVEFTLARAVDDGVTPLDDNLCFSTIGMQKNAAVMYPILDGLAAVGLNVEQYYSELGPGQNEVSISPAPAVQAADNQVYLREVVRGVALQQGVLASFAPKPFPDKVGNGAHLHFSLWGDGENVTGAPVGRQFMAGVLAHVRALCALTAPTMNSYRRLAPQSWASAFTCYGPDNREACLRVPSTYRGSEAETTNLELRSVDSTCNPYLALGGLIAAGLDGIARGLEPGEPVTVDPATMTESERQRRGIRRLPGSLKEALDELEANRVLADAMGERLLRSFLQVKGAEYAAFAAEDVDFEIRHHFHKF